MWRYSNNTRFRVLPFVSIIYRLLQVLNQVLLPPNLLEQLTITTEVTNSYSFYQFLSLLDSSHINLTNVHDVTVFAPLDGAFDETTNVTSTWSMLLNKLLHPAWIRHLKSLVSNHITDSVISTSTLMAEDPTKLTMKSGYILPVQAVNSSGGGSSGSRSIILVDGTARVVLPDLYATNG
jgi:uncharacterized surface protein with fasciclin (FAS1) repeats